MTETLLILMAWVISGVIVTAWFHHWSSCGECRPITVGDLVWFACSTLFFWPVVLILRPVVWLLENSDRVIWPCPGKRK